ncbi:MAG: GNAT family N-acetyltransferase [Rivularia sp. ALOHA_DT_140]|nr:GNAT family N-acetyltransferase [Rivularia sp. ALOHA_DT_140]
MSLDIRTASLEDVNLLIELYAGMNGESPLPNDLAKEIFAAIIRIPNYHIYLVFNNNQPVATFSLLHLPTMMYQGYHKYAVLDAVTVSPKFRSQGIGREMIKTAMKMSADEGCYKVTLSSSLKRERAHRFYKSLGFEQHGWSFESVLQTA